MSDNVNHKLDHKIKAESEDPIWHIHEYDVDLQSNHIYLFGREHYVVGTETPSSEPGVEYTMANRFIRNLNLCMRVNPKTPIVIHMKSCGGDFTEGMAIYDSIKSSPVPITILNYTHARSMSSLIFQAANKRIMMPHSYFLYHEGTLEYSGTYKQVMSSAEFDKKSNDEMVNIYENVLKRGGLYKSRSRKWIRNWIKSQMDKREDVYVTAKDAVKLGFADEVFDYNWYRLTDYTDEQLTRG